MPVTGFHCDGSEEPHSRCNTFYTEKSNTPQLCGSLRYETHDLTSRTSRRSNAFRGASICKNDRYVDHMAVKISSGKPGAFEDIFGV